MINCDICKQPIEAFSSFTSTPFIDGKKHDIICHVCCHIPKQLDAQGNGPYYRSDYLNSIDELINFGFDKIAAIASRKAVLAKINKKIIILDRIETAPNNTVLIVEDIREDEKLYISDNTISDRKTEPIIQINGLKCVKCGILLSSKSGKTLHEKKCQGRSDDTSLNCPFCNKVCSSSSGRSLHIKCCKHKV